MAFRFANAKGQGLIETVALSAALMAFFTGLSAVLYFGLVHTGMHYLLHENLVCEQTQHHGDCAREFKTRAAPWLFLAELRSFQTVKVLGKIRSRAQIVMPLKKVLTISNEMDFR